MDITGQEQRETLEKLETFHTYNLSKHNQRLNYKYANTTKPIFDTILTHSQKQNTKPDKTPTEQKTQSNINAPQSNSLHVSRLQYTKNRKIISILQNQRLPTRRKHVVLKTAYC